MSAGRIIWLVVDKHGDVVSSHSNKRDALAAAKQYRKEDGPGYRLRRQIVANPSRRTTMRKRKRATVRRRKTARRKNPNIRSANLKNFTGKVMIGADKVVRILGLSK